MPRLSQEETVSIRVLDGKEMERRKIARALGVSEGAVRYHLRKAAEGRSGEDGRRGKETASVPWITQHLPKQVVFGSDRPDRPSDPGWTTAPER